MRSNFRIVFRILFLTGLLLGLLSSLFTKNGQLKSLLLTMAMISLSAAILQMVLFKIWPALFKMKSGNNEFNK
jgi:ribose/xylose/arabinose/galactoside ABC-type transport system permease subunit